MFIIKLILIYFFFCSLIFAQVWTNYSATDSDLPANQIKSLLIDENGIKWIGTNNGMASLNGETWTVFSKNSSDLPNNSINDLTLEKMGEDIFLWIATDSGLCKAQIIDTDSLLFLDTYTSLENDSGLVNNFVTSAAVDQNNIGWFGTDSGASSFDGENWASYTVENFWIFNNRVTEIDIGPDTMVYLATEGRGISRLKIDAVDGITGASRIDIQWSGADDGGDKLPSDSVYSVLIQPNGWQWYGTNKGVSVHTSYNTRRDWITYKASDGLANNFVQAIYQDSFGWWWFGTLDGLSHLKNIEHGASNWNTYTMDNGLAGNSINVIAEDQQGNIWVGTNNGLSTTHIIASIGPEEKVFLPTISKISNYPNPFNGETIIEFYTDSHTDLKIDIYNMLGQLTKKLGRFSSAQGYNSLKWNGKNDKNQIVPSGAYLVVLKENFETKSHLIMFIK